MDGTKVRNDVIAVTDAQAAGAMVWWELSGLVETEKLRTAWAAARLPDIVPDDTAPTAALRRAVNELAEQRKLVRPLAGRDGYSLVEETAEGSSLAYAQQVVATVDSVGRLVLSPADSPLAEQIMDSYAKHLEHLVPSDVSQVLVSLAESQQALSLRGRGGFYFLPPAGLEKFRAAARVLRTVSSHVCYEIPAMRSDRAVEAILAAVEREALAEATTIEKAIDEGMGARALRGKADHVAQVERKVAIYERLLGTSLVDLQERLQTLRARLSEAAIVATTTEAK